ncbi:MAG: hypothetical protein EOP34_07210 [Rickettsiales bacterium]|nr:MAG: hypothetical protein EOP34_07210 [Rickettsiales bacterium]
MSVPVINKTNGLFARDSKNEIITLLDNETLQLLDSPNKIITVKTDGTCGLLVKMVVNETSVYTLMRRQDIKVGSKNFDKVNKNLTLTSVAGRKCIISSITRGGGKNTLDVPFYIFQLTNDDKPEIEVNHLIGFTPITNKCGDDKHLLSCLHGENMSTDLKIYCSVSTTNFDVDVRLTSAEQILKDSDLITVEIMGAKISNKYGFDNDRHFINPHGSIECNKHSGPPLHDYDLLKAWFQSENRWADVEGYVVHFPDVGKRLKVHRGHVGLEKSWRDKKSSGLVFNFV